MRLFIIALTILSMCFYGCKNTQKSSHEHETAEEHAAHNHDHEHEGHNHEEEEHENGEGHSDEIIFTKAQAAKTTRLSKRQVRCFRLPEMNRSS